MESHAYSFEGGDKLAKMGAAWFVSYAYHEKVDGSHKNWGRVSTVATRSSVYNSTREFHKLWLRYVADMSDASLEKNTIGLDGESIKEMAEAVLSVM